MPIDASLAVAWLVLLGVSFALLVPIAVVAWAQHRRERPRAAPPAELSEWEQHAAVVAQRSGQAAAEADLAHQRAVAAEQARARAWSALEQAEQACRVAERAHQEASGQPPGDPAVRREVAGAALAAYRRGDLSQEQLWRVWRWGSGWDPERERREHELTAVRARVRDARLRYRAAADAERAALRRAEVADAQARALREEAALAETEVAQARAR